MKQDRDAAVALLLEAIGELFGLLGIGWIYAGRRASAIVLLLSHWL